ncbi:addiction module protein [Sulfurimonas sp.]|uniref:addiction module protein n=1 Tax=Sulfurimonas sp. TaxID=2022749 RepID=UPI001A05E607|nr:addiction module protein [Sulfurimonas sp.]MBE0515634.1 addiction module protein [Sulfurimonas sp.]
MTALKQEQLFDEIDILPIDLKTKIVDKILASITPINSEIDKLWIKEVNKRKQEIESNSVTLVDGDEVFKKISQNYTPENESPLLTQTLF